MFPPPPPPVLRNFDLSHKIILINDAATYPGAAIAARLHRAGAVICLAGAYRHELAALAESLGRDKNKIEILDFDCIDPHAVARAVDYMGIKFGRLDGLVNNIFKKLSGADSPDIEDFENCYKCNVNPIFDLSQKCIPLLQKADGSNISCIVNIASIYGMISPEALIDKGTGLSNQPFYAASHAEIIQLTKHFSAHFISSGIRTNTVSLGIVPSASALSDNPDLFERLRQQIPMKRIGYAEEVAAAVHFLLSDDAMYINGINMPVDGGWTAC